MKKHSIIVCVEFFVGQQKSTLSKKKRDGSHTHTHEHMHVCMHTHTVVVTHSVVQKLHWLEVFLTWETQILKVESLTQTVRSVRVVSTSHMFLSLSVSVSLSLSLSLSLTCSVSVSSCLHFLGALSVSSCLSLPCSFAHWLTLSPVLCVWFVVRHSHCVCMCRAPSTVSRL